MCSPRCAQYDASLEQLGSSADKDDDGGGAQAPPPLFSRQASASRQHLQGAAALSELQVLGPHTSPSDYQTRSQLNPRRGSTHALHDRSLESACYRFLTFLAATLAPPLAVALAFTASCPYRLMPTLRLRSAWQVAVPDDTHDRRSWLLRQWTGSGRLSPTSPSSPRAKRTIEAKVRVRRRLCCRDMGIHKPLLRTILFHLVSTPVDPLVHPLSPYAPSSPLSYRATASMLPSSAFSAQVRRAAIVRLQSFSRGRRARRDGERRQHAVQSILRSARAHLAKAKGPQERLGFGSSVSRFPSSLPIVVGRAVLQGAAATDLDFVRSSAQRMQQLEQMPARDPAPPPPCQLVRPATAPSLPQPIDASSLKAIAQHRPWQPGVGCTTVVRSAPIAVPIDWEARARSLREMKHRRPSPAASILGERRERMPATAPQSDVVPGTRGGRRGDSHGGSHGHPPGGRRGGGAANREGVVVEYGALGLTVVSASTPNLLPRGANCHAADHVLTTITPASTPTRAQPTSTRTAQAPTQSTPEAHGEYRIPSWMDVSRDPFALYGQGQQAPLSPDAPGTSPRAYASPRRRSGEQLLRSKLAAQPAAVHDPAAESQSSKVEVVLPAPPAVFTRQPFEAPRVYVYEPPPKPRRSALVGSHASAQAPPRAGLLSSTSVTKISISPQPGAAGMAGPRHKPHRQSKRGGSSQGIVPCFATPPRRPRQLHERMDATQVRLRRLDCPVLCNDCHPLGCPLHAPPSRFALLSRLPPHAMPSPYFGLLPESTA